MLDRLTIERMMAKAGDTPILIALSGGGDSVALMHLLADHFGAARLRAAVVDHAVRDGSAQDAQRAASFAAARDIEAQILTLAWPEGPQTTQQAFRERRYVTLCDYARALDVRVIAVAHSADDQAETVLMRAAAGSSWRGLAAMAPVSAAPVWPEGRGITLGRPLLATRRAALRDELRRRGAAWIEDPANANPAFERVRVRARLTALEAEGLDTLRFVRLAAKLRVHADAIDSAASDIASAARFDNDRIVIARADWRGAEDARRRALSVLLAAAAGAQREPDGDAIARLEARLLGADFRGASLGGANIAVTGANLVISRDRGALSGRADGAPSLSPLPLPEGGEVVFDGRVALNMPEPGWSVAIANGALTLQRGEERAALVAGSPHWLLKTRVQHALGCD